MSLVLSWLNCGALMKVDTEGCYYVGGLRPNGAQVGRFPSWGTVIPKGLLPKVPASCCPYITQPRPNQRGHPHIRVDPHCTKKALRQKSA